jgi:two-component system, NtrC family, nitrogen regulation sensor histidine kinase NtrY
LKFFQKYGFISLSLLFLLSFFYYYNSTFDNKFKEDAVNFQKVFLEQEHKLENYLSSKYSILKEKNLDDLINNSKENNYNLHIYRNDSLLFWNTNKLPILRFADIHFPSEGILKLQNGWYYSKIKNYGNLKIVASFLIKRIFPYENDYLKSEFRNDFNFIGDANIILEKENAHPIYDKNKDYIFSLQSIEKSVLSDFESNVLVLLFLCFLIFFLYTVYNFCLEKKNAIIFSVSSLLILIHYFLIRFDLYNFLEKTSFYDPTLYANSSWFPNLIVFILNCLFIYFYLSCIILILKTLKKSKLNKIISLLLYLMSSSFSFLIGYLYHSLVKDSSIPLEIDKLFQLNYYSFWASLCMGILFFTYFILIRALFKAMINAGWRKTSIVVIWFFCSTIYFILDIIFGSELLFLATWPLIINGIIVVNVIRANGKFNFNYGVILLFIFSIFISININNFNEKKEFSERKLYANQLASDQDVSTELQFFELSKKIKNDAYFEKIIQNNRNLGVSEFKDYMERKFYTSFWDKYELEFYLFNKSTPLINHANVQNSSLESLEKIVRNHSKKSEISDEVFYIKDYTSQLSYICKQKIFNRDSSVHLLLFTSLKSKRIPEKIGFPRLLISNQSHVFKAIENYSIAKYYNGKLISQYGKFSYPTLDIALKESKFKSSGFFVNEGFNHYLFQKNERDLIVLSKKIPSNFQLFTSFSYLFCFFGFFLVLILLFRNRKSLEFGNLTLALKIQLILISIVVVALLAFGYGSGKFVSNQYNEYSSELIKEKIKSVHFEVKSKLGDQEQLKIELQGDFMYSILQKFANVFVTDINLYDKSGYILASSRPKIFNVGLLSEQINPIAFEQIEQAKKSEFIHQENIGKLNYLSAYVPLFNNKGDFLAYINLQHFGQQQGFENQIEGFLVAIINVFILLLAFSIILSILVSNWVTSPLKILQNSFAKIQLGKYNEPIQYESKDEIGALVKNYNQKLEELAFTAQQLAQSERETAWREMAKQVAHEIKNPLTPMKLSLQHLQRVYDPSDPNSQEKLNKVVSSIIEQIDSLTKIANEFSSFAKMPKENKEKMDVLPILEHTVVVFNQENSIEIEIFNKASATQIFGDKDLMLRVFNNLIKNAIQAIPENKKGKISVRLSNQNQKLTIEIEDNGKGIPEEMKHKIFMPNFTTKSTGMGLGLAMVKQIVQLHEGEIWFESKVNKTLFVIELPLYL